MQLPRIFRRKHSAPNVNFYQYTQAPVFTNGALQFVFEQKWEYPIQVLEGAGKRAGQFMIYQRPQLRAQLALTSASLQGAGVFSGSTQMQRLWRENEYGQIQVGDEVIP